MRDVPGGRTGDDIRTGMRMGESRSTTKGEGMEAGREVQHDGTRWAGFGVWALFCEVNGVSCPVGAEGKQRGELGSRPRDMANCARSAFVWLRKRGTCSRF